MYKIGDFSKLGRVTVKTLRYYDQMELLRPIHIDEFSGYRYYSAAQLSDLNRILALREAGFMLEEIKSLLDRNITSEETLEILETKTRGIRQGIREEQMRLSKLETIGNLLRREMSTMDYNIIVKEVEPVKVAFIREIVPEEGYVPRQLEKLCRYLKKQGVRYDPSYRVICHDVEYCEKDKDIEVAVPVYGNVPESEGIRCRELEGQSSMGSIICGSNREGKENALNSILYWLDKNVYQIIGPYREIHLAEGEPDADPGEHTVEIQIPVHPYGLGGEQPMKVVSEDIDLPFVNDPLIVGKWESVDIVYAKEQFNPLKLKFSGTLPYEELYFLPGGKRYWIFGWTKGYILKSAGGGNTVNRYEIADINGVIYMFMELKNNDYLRYGQKPVLCVLKKVDNYEYSEDEIRVIDRTDFPFVKDPEVIGKWVSIDYVRNIEDFNPSRQNWRGDSFLKELTFYENGGTSLSNTTWTEGLVLSHRDKTASRYEIKRLHGREFLFYEWKSGDYSYGRRKPSYYVLERAE